ncbi:hypothetical protein RFI_20161, partial [Reticulomyxa filosa]
MSGMPPMKYSGGMNGPHYRMIGNGGGGSGKIGSIGGSGGGGGGGGGGSSNGGNGGGGQGKMSAYGFSHNGDPSQMHIANSGNSNSPPPLISSAPSPDHSLPEKVRMLQKYQYPSKLEKIIITTTANSANKPNNGKGEPFYRVYLGQFEALVFGKMSYETLTDIGTRVVLSTSSKNTKNINAFTLNDGDYVGTVDNTTAMIFASFIANENERETGHSTQYAGKK